MTGRVIAVAVCVMVLVSVSAHAAARNLDKAAIDRYVERTWPTKKAKLIKWVIARESNYDPKAKNGNCVGLMQINTRVWFSQAPEYNLIKLGIIKRRSDLYQAIPNIRAGVYILKHYGWDYRRYRGKSIDGKPN